MDRCIWGRRGGAWSRSKEDSSEGTEHTQAAWVTGGWCGGRWERQHLEKKKNFLLPVFCFLSSSFLSQLSYVCIFLMSVCGWMSERVLCVYEYVCMHVCLYDRDESRVLSDGGRNGCGGMYGNIGTEHYDCFEKRKIAKWFNISLFFPEWWCCKGLKWARRGW